MAPPPPVYVPVTPAIAPPPPAPPAPAPAAGLKPIAPTAPPFKIETPAGAVRLGILMQPQYEAAGDVTRNGLQSNLYLRRIRLLVGGTLFGVIDYFIETDSPNTLKAVAGGTAMAPTYLKTTNAMVIQDAFATVKPMGDLIKVDAGFMLPPMAHNAIQGATTLYGWDYYAYTFQHSVGANANAFGTAAGPVGRDLGVQLRGLVMDGHIEYRAGLFQGIRNAQTASEQGGRNFFRAMARVQINLLDPEPGFFYSGTYFGAKRILSVGGSYDFQDKYKYFAFDAFADMPAGPGVATAQVNFGHWDGGTYIPTLIKQNAIMGEAGYNLAGLKVSPIVRYEHLSGSTGVPTQARYAGGLAYWPYGHNSNLKVFYTRLQQTGALHGANQINAQWQIFFF